MHCIEQHHYRTHSYSECGKGCKDSLNESLGRLLCSEKLIRPLSTVYDEFTLYVECFTSYLNAFGKNTEYVLELHFSCLYGGTLTNK